MTFYGAADGQSGDAMGLRDQLREDRERRKQEFAEKKDELRANRERRNEEAAEKNERRRQGFEESRAAQAAKWEESKAASRERRAELRERLAEQREVRAGLRSSGRDRVAEAREEGARSIARAAGIDTAGAIMTMTSHEDGRNAIVALFPDRLERTKPRSAAALTKTPKEREVIPVSRVSHVRIAKDGALKVAVHVTVSGEDIVFRVSRAEGERFRDELMRLVLAPTQAVPASAPTDDPADQLRKFAALRNDGVISEEDFQAKKKQILGL